MFASVSPDYNQPAYEVMSDCMNPEPNSETKGVYRPPSQRREPHSDVSRSLKNHFSRMS